MGGEFGYQTVDQVDVGGKVVIVRADLNVPLKNGQIVDDTRIEATVETLTYLLDQGVKRLFVISHLGRPDGFDDKLSLKPVAERMSELLAEPVSLVEIRNFEPKPSTKVALFENIRFYPEEKSNDRVFVEQIVAKTGADLFVEDGFGVCHRATATTTTICKLLPAFASLRLADEYQSISTFARTAKRPLVGLLGGAKVGDKIGFINRIIQQADQVVIGGAMAQAFLAAKGLRIGASQIDDKDVELAAEVLNLAKDLKKTLILPVDVVVADGFEANQSEVRLVSQVRNDDIIFDVGPETQKLVVSVIEHSGAVIWNGNFGYTENELFQAGTKAVVEAIDRHRPKVLLGGGDTVAFAKQIKPNWRYDGLIISTGGGAMLELIANGDLVGVKCLRQK